MSENGVSPLIEARRISYSRRGKIILQDVSVSVQPGEIVTLIGPNGAGKTTLTRLLLGMLQPDSGTVRRRAGGLRLGYMPQKVRIEPHLPLTVIRFLRLARNRRSTIEHIAGLVQIEGLLRSPIHTISGGEMQRVLLARALLCEPELLILDEPVQGIDVAGQSSLYQLIVQLRDRLGCGVLMVSHDLHLVLASTDTVVCLNTHVCCHGHPDSVSTHPAFLELFGETRDTSLAVYKHHHDHLHDPLPGVRKEES